MLDFYRNIDIYKTNKKVMWKTIKVAPKCEKKKKNFTHTPYLSKNVNGKEPQDN